MASKRKICARGATSWGIGGGWGGSGVRDMALLLLGNLRAKFSETLPSFNANCPLSSSDNNLKRLIPIILLCLQCSLYKMCGPEKKSSG